MLHSGYLIYRADGTLTDVVRAPGLARDLAERLARVYHETITVKRGNGAVFYVAHGQLSLEETKADD